MPTKAPKQPPSKQATPADAKTTAKHLATNKTGKKVEDVAENGHGIFWPAALLSTEVPNTRIWTWGYDADIDGFWKSSSQNTVTQHAANLLSDLADLLESDGGNLPLFFIVHSLGGIIVKAVGLLISKTIITTFTVFSVYIKCCFRV
jgi:hypothetical protein